MWNLAATHAWIPAVAAIILGGLVWWLFTGPPPPPLPTEPHRRRPPDLERRPGRIRRSSAAMPTDRADEMAPRASQASAGALSRISVLLVEDDDDSRQLLAGTLEYYGAKVAAVSSTAEALRLLERHHADVLLSDLCLPLHDGFALIRELRTQPDPVIASIPAASITASRRPGDRRSALEAGYQMHLQKPVDPDDLVSAVLALATSRG